MTAKLRRAPALGWCLLLATSLGLWSVVSISHAVTWTELGLQVGGGHIGSYEWRVSIEPPENRDEPCVSTQLWRRHTSTARTSPVQTVCGSVVPVPTQLIYSVGSGRSEKAVIAIGVDRKAKKVRIDLGSRGVRWYRPRVLTPDQGRRVHSAQFGYIAGAMTGRVCIHQISTFDKYGVEIWRSIKSGCPGL
jgi:hypothetical protein